MRPLPERPGLLGRLHWRRVRQRGALHLRLRGPLHRKLAGLRLVLGLRLRNGGPGPEGAPAAANDRRGADALPPGHLPHCPEASSFTRRTRPAPQIATSTPELSDLLAAVGAADPSILALLSDPTATITVFAPTNDAFEAVDAFTRAVTTGEIPDQAVVTKVLQKHVVGSVVPASAALDLVNEAVPTLAGEDITVDGSTCSVTVLPVIVEPKSVPANVIQADIYASIGVVHVIDKVLALTPVPGEFDGGCYTGGVCNGAHGCCDCSITNEADCPSPPYIPGTDVARFLPVGCKSGGICQYP